MPHDHFQKIKNFDPPPPQHPPSPLGYNLRDWMKVMYDMFYIFHTKLGLKIFGIDFAIEI